MVMLVPSLLSVQVALPREVQTANGPLRTGMVKLAVAGPIQVGLRALAGDGCADLVHHGLEDQSVCVYPAEHYAWWREYLQRDAVGLPYGSFGENFTVAGQLEQSAYVGDRYRIGSAIVEITKPRRPCSTLNKVWGDSQMVAQMGRRALTGWYLRVLQVGTVQAGDLCELLERQLDAPNICDAWREMDRGTTS